MKRSAHKLGTGRRNRPASGFSLIELMVATAISAIIMGMMFAIISGILDQGNRVKKSLQGGMTLRGMMEVMRKDFQAIHKSRKHVWLVARPALSDSGNAVHTVRGQDTTQLMFYTAAPDRTLEDPGDLCAVGYRLGYGNPFASASGDRFGIYRTVVEARDTLDLALGDAPALLAFWGTRWGANGATLNGTDYLGGQVVGFQVVLTYRDSTGTVRTINPGSTVEAGPRLLVNNVPVDGDLVGIQCNLLTISSRGQVQLRDHMTNGSGVPVQVIFNRETINYAVTAQFLSEL